MATLTRFSTPQIEIGEPVFVLAGSFNNEVIANTQGKFVRAGGFYNQADYPELYARIGAIGANAYFAIRTSGTTSEIYALTYGNGIYVYGGSNGPLSTSTDGITWTSRTSAHVNSDIRSLTYGNGIYVYGDSSGRLATSTDGITWTSRTSQTTFALYSLIYGN
jgi:hypothetical protein